MARKRPPPAPPADGDGDLWRRVSGSVRPLKGRAPGRPAAAPERNEGNGGVSPGPGTRTAGARGASPRRGPPPAPAPLPELSPGRAPGLDKRTGLRLRRGQMAIEGRIDLHGMTQAEAHGRLAAFLAESAAAGKRTVLVITGRGAARLAEGGGVLRAQLPRWLNGPELRPLVLAFATAQPKDGGAGAFYVYLKRARGR